MSTFNDMVYQFGGSPVSSGGNFAGWWDTTVWFVDGDNGNNANSGKKPTAAFSTITKAITEAAAGDTIYVRNRIPQSDASDPTLYAENLTIPFAKSRMSIIGTSPSAGNPYFGPKIKLTGAVWAVDVEAANTNLENLNVHKTGTNSGGIRLNGVSGYATLAGSCGSTVSNCMLRYAGTTTAAGISIVGGYSTITSNCVFMSCSTGWAITSTVLPSRGHEIRNSRFLGNNGAAVAGPYIYMQGAANEVVIANCHFGQDTSQDPGAYVYCTGVVDGAMTNCYLGRAGDCVVAATGADVQEGDGAFAVVGCWDRGSQAIHS